MLFRNNGDGTFTDVAYVNGADAVEDGRGLTVFDYDSDGQLDCLLRNYQQPAQLLQNRGGRGHWLELKLVGTRSNRDAVGAGSACAPATAGRRARSQPAPPTCRSRARPALRRLAEENLIRELEITWPSGATTRFDDLEGGHRFTITENSLTPITCADPACPD